MNKNKLLIVVIISLGLVGTACRKNNLDKLSDSDQEAFEDLEDAYSEAKVYNDSLEYCAGSTNLCQDAFIHHCDSMFHVYEHQWNENHDRYGHDNAHDDHYHDEHGMQHHRSRRHHDNEEGHHEYDHNMMDQLLHDHRLYHP